MNFGIIMAQRTRSGACSYRIWHNSYVFKANYGK